MTAGRGTIVVWLVLGAVATGCAEDAGADAGAAGADAGAAGAPPDGAVTSTPPPRTGGVIPPGESWFTEVSAEAGIDFVHTHGGRKKKFLFETMGSGVAIAELDGDGRPDVLFLQSGTLPPGEFTEKERTRARHATGRTNALYHNLGDFRFEDRTEGSGLDEAFYGMGLAVGDTDGDGDRDLFIAAYGRDRLYENDGAGHFAEVTAEAGVDDTDWNIGGAFVDVDLDGDLDLYVLGYLDMPISSHRACGPSPDRRTYCHVDTWDGEDDHLWINDGTGRFRDGSDGAALVGSRGKGLAVVSGDWDDDGDFDLFVANDSQPNFMLRNAGDGTFEEVGRFSGTDLSGEGRTEACMGVDMGDLDGDLDLDLYVVNFQQETNTLYRNDGGGFFTDVSVLSGAGGPSLRQLGFGTVFFDLDLDTDLDIYVANGHIMDNIAEIESDSEYAQADQLFVNDGRGRFALAPPSAAVSLAERRVGRGLARGDLDGDGDQDLVVTNSDERPWVLRNDRGAGHRIVLRLLGPGGRADAEGARLTARIGDRTVLRELHGGGSYLSHNDAEIVFGLGEAEAMDRLVIRWPGGEASEHADLAADRRYTFAFGGELLSSEELAAWSRPTR